MEKLFVCLKELGITYTVLEHKVITTMEQGKEIMKKLDGIVPICLFLKDNIRKIKR